MKKQLDITRITYEQNIDSLTIQFIEFDSKDSIKWQTKLINKKNNNELILNEELKVKGPAWSHYEFINEQPEKLYQMAGAFLSGKDLLVTYYQLGAFLIRKYHFTDPLTFEMNEVILGGAMALPSYGKVTAEAKFVKIKNEVFISACFGQDFRGVHKKLFKLDITSFVPTEIVFDPNPIRFIGVGIGDRAGDHLKSLRRRKEENILTPSLEQELLFLTEYTEKPYYFKQVGLDRNIDLRKEAYSYIYSGLDLYYFFLIRDQDLFLTKDQENSKLPYATLQDITRYSCDMLSFYKQDVSEHIKILGYICNDYVSDVGNDGADIFIFYQDALQEVKILQYQNFDPMWIISDYKEIEINQEN